MFNAIGRFFAVLVGLVFVLGGGVCTAMDAAFFFSALLNGSASTAFLLLLGIGLSLGFLRIGLWMMGMSSNRTTVPPLPEPTGPDAYLNKRIFISVLTLAGDGEVVDRLQMHGFGSSVDDSNLLVELRGKTLGKTWKVPLKSILPAPSDGTYIIESTGEKVWYPDYIAEIRRQRNAPVEA